MFTYYYSPARETHFVLFTIDGTPPHPPARYRGEFSNLRVAGGPAILVQWGFGTRNRVNDAVCRTLPLQVRGSHLTLMLDQPSRGWDLCFDRGATPQFDKQLTARPDTLSHELGHLTNML